MMAKPNLGKLFDFRDESIQTSLNRDELIQKLPNRNDIRRNIF